MMMTMSARERVRHTLEFSGPDRVARDLWWLPWAEINYPADLARIRGDFPMDIIAAPAVYRQQPVTRGDMYELGSYTDEWGCKFLNVQRGAIGEVKDPLVRDWTEATEVVHFPTEWLDFDRTAANDFCGNSDQWVNAPVVPRPFERLQFLRGTEQLYMDLAMEDLGLKAFLGRLHQFYLDLLEAWAKTDVDGLMIMDDWGAQRALLVRPAMWRAWFKPLYAEYAELAHQYGKKLFMHSDGFILDILPDLVEIGIDAINSQVFCMGVHALQAFRGKITFWGEIDRQRLLPFGSVQEIRHAVQSFHDSLYCNGGVIAQCEFGLKAKPENVYEVYAQWERLRPAEV